MMRNEGTTERLIQVAVAMMFLAIGAFVVAGPWRWVFFGLSAMVLFFSSVAFCPLYVLLGRNTACRLPKRK